MTSSALIQRFRWQIVGFVGLLLVIAAVLGVRRRSGSDAPRVIGIATAGTMHEGKLTVTSQSARVAEEGWLERELAKRGIRLEWHYVPGNLGGPGYTEALANKVVQFASYGDLPALIGKSGGVNSRLIVPYGGGGNSYLVVAANSSARSILDLKGKRISLQRGRPAELPFTKLLRAYGIKSDEFRLYNLAGEAGQSALVAGSVDAYFGGVDAYLLEEKGLARIIWSTKEPVNDTKIARSRVDLYAREDFTREQPELTQLVATAYVRAAYWQAQEENKDAVLRVLSRPGTPARVLKRDQDGEIIAWRDRWSPLFDDFLYDGFRSAVAVSLERRLLTRSVDVDEYLDPRFARQALRDLKIEGFWQPRASWDAASGAVKPASLAVKPEISEVAGSR